MKKISKDGEESVNETPVTENTKNKSKPKKKKIVAIIAILLVVVLGVVIMTNEDIQKDINAGQEAADEYYDSYDESEESEEETEPDAETEYLFDGVLKSDSISGATFDLTLDELLDRYNEITTEQYGDTDDTYKLNKTKDDITTSAEVEGDCTEYVIPYEVPGIDETILAVHIYVYNPTEKVIKVTYTLDNNYAQQWLAVADGSDTESVEYDYFTIYMYSVNTAWVGAARDQNFDDASEVFFEVMQEGYIYEDGFGCKNYTTEVDAGELFCFEYVACTEDYL